MSPHPLPPALLEGWMRDYYFDTDLDLGSSGVEPFGFAELRRLLDLTIDELDAVVFRDSRTLGDDALRAAIAARWGAGDPNGVMVTHGSSEAIALVMQACVRPGDEVVLLEPVYQQLRAIPEATGARIIAVPLHASSGFRPDATAIMRAIGPGTRLVVLNLPNNPTGAALSAAEEDAIAARAALQGATVLWDRAFSDIVHAPDVGFRQRRAPHEITVGTLSKSFGLPGLRVGWILAEPAFIDGLAHPRDYTTLHLSPLVELIACRAITRADTLLASRIALARENLRTMEGWAAAHADLIDWIPPAGGVCGFPRLPRVPDVDAFCRALARRARVLLVPGSCFQHPAHVRLGFGGAGEALHEGLRQLSRALHDSVLTTRSA